MKLDLSPLGIAVGQLKEGLVLYDSDIVRQYQEIRGQMRAGAIQAFESICEVSVRMIQRYLEQVRLILRKVTGPNYGHLPDKQAKATQTVLNQSQGGMCICLRRGIVPGVSRECFGP